ncbi:hypothetical protein [Escherichia coli]|uniref:hypothetical protein n=1 Tax=Escherichia coli TaxID=562 RepID=UPI001562B9E0|nr:hypothetical protein [Escherichia coli]MBC0494628.1 hypothetical protein [Escherichia coli]
MQKYKQESLSAAMKESGLLIAKICACVIAGVVVIWGLVTGTVRCTGNSGHYHLFFF